MAIYMYKCDACSFEFDVNKPMRQAGEVESCPKCGKTPAVRVYTPPAGIIIEW